MSKDGGDRHRHICRQLRVRGWRGAPGSTLIARRRNAVSGDKQGTLTYSLVGDEARVEAECMSPKYGHSGVRRAAGGKGVYCIGNKGGDTRAHLTQADTGTLMGSRTFCQVRTSAFGFWYSFPLVVTTSLESVRAPTRAER